MPTPTPFKFTLGQPLAITCSHEHGTCLGRSEHLTSEPQYYLRYKAANGLATEAWWAQSALTAMAPAALSDDELLRALTPDTTNAPTTAPAIGQPWPAQGGIYAGIARGIDGAVDHHLILSADKPASTLDWKAAQDWAAKLRTDGHADWCIPTRAEGALLFANLRDQFEREWHWTSEQYSRGGAWNQYFDDGGQDSGGKSFQGRARAVRRLVIQSFSHS